MMIDRIFRYRLDQIGKCNLDRFVALHLKAISNVYLAYLGTHGSPKKQSDMQVDGALFLPGTLENTNNIRPNAGYSTKVTMCNYPTA